jgi:hypothetical protein
MLVEQVVIHAVGQAVLVPQPILEGRVGRERSREGLRAEQ